MVFPEAMAGLAQCGLLTSGGPDGSKGFMDALPDPMKLDLGTLIFVMVLVTGLFLFMKYVFFKPIVRVMDDREALIHSGSARRAEAAALVEARQAEYAARLHELRSKAFEHRKALAGAAAQSKAALLDQARQEAAAQLATAAEALQAAQEAAKTQLLAQVGGLSDSVVQHLLRQA
jgi:F0F1-type ATP synthase membrane subunit b/b'